MRVGLTDLKHCLTPSDTLGVIVQGKEVGWKVLVGSDHAWHYYPMAIIVTTVVIFSTAIIPHKSAAQCVPRSTRVSRLGRH